MAIILCPKCGKRMVTDKVLIGHLAKAHPENVDSPPPSPTPEAVSPSVPEMIKLHFNSPIEVTINGVKFEGCDVEVKDMQTACEVVRIAKEAYGRMVIG